jgi:hypothetical protein
MSAKLNTLILLSVIVLLLVPSTVTLAGGETVYINPYGGEYTISTKDEIVIRIGWGTCSKGLTIDYVDSVHNVFFLNGELIEKAQKKDKEFYKEPIVFDDAPWASLCIWDVDRTWGVPWEYKLGKLDAGTYELVWERTYDFNVIDGYDLDGDGIPDMHGEFTRIVTIIHVIEP